MIGLDIETTSLEVDEGEWSLAQVYDPAVGYVMVYDVLQGGRPPLPSRAVAHTAVFEERWLRKYGYDPELDDTMIASQVFYTGTNAARTHNLSHKLAACVARELKRELPKDEQKSDWSVRPLTREQLEYAARDAIVLPELFERLITKVEKADLRRVYDLELRVARAVDQMQRNGFAVNEAKLEPLIDEVTEQAETLKAELEAEWGINPGSSKQLREYFELDAVEGWPRTPAGAPKTDQDSMKLLDHEDMSKWLEWKRVEKLRSTYGTSLQKYIRNGRIHARFKPFGAATGRFSSSNPNLQNIPKDERLRSLFWSGSEDRVLVKADYAGIELWLAAVLWGEKNMQRVLAEGTNLHTYTASQIYRRPTEEIGKDSVERAVGKTANFALLYGAGANRMQTQLASEGVQVSQQEAQGIVEKFLDTYPAFRTRRRELAQGHASGKIRSTRTPIGRRRADKVEWYGPLMNHEIQGTGADGMKYAIARMHEDPYPGAKLVCTVHDEVVVECDKEEADAVAEWVSGHMTEGMLEAVCIPWEELPCLPIAETTVARDWS
jgi:DNA polymerase-1